MILNISIYVYETQELSFHKGNNSVQIFTRVSEPIWSHENNASDKMFMYCTEKYLCDMYWYL
jgi:hypothetical protein